MAFNPQNFRLTSRSRRTYQLVVEGGGGPGPPGPQGPPGPNGAAGANGAGAVDYDDVGVDQGIDYTPFAQDIFRVVVPIAAGPNNNEITVAHGVSGLLDVAVIEMRGALGSAGGDWFPVPFAASAAESTGTADITLRADDTNVYISSIDNLSGLSGFIVIDYLA